MTLYENMASPGVGRVHLQSICEGRVEMAVRHALMSHHASSASVDTTGKAAAEAVVQRRTATHGHQSSIHY